jgi:cytochrome c-type biogenesis protein CcmH/NrfG
MSKREQDSSHRQAADRENWTGTKAYVLAVFCLVVGVAPGYLFRGSASPLAETATTAGPANGSVPHGQSRQGEVSPEQQKAMLDQAVAPLLAALQTSPDDFNTLVQLADIYYDGRQYPEAIKYYQLAAKSQPENADVLTDLGTSLWYTGDAMEPSPSFRRP